MAAGGRTANNQATEEERRQKMRKVKHSIDVGVRGKECGAGET